MSTSTSTSTRSVDVAPRGRLGSAHLALVLAIVSLPGSLLPWDWFTAGGLVVGIPLALGAIVVGLRARRAAAPGSGASRVALAAVVLAAAVLLIPVAYSIASLAS